MITMRKFIAIALLSMAFMSSGAMAACVTVKGGGLDQKIKEGFSAAKNTDALLAVCATYAGAMPARKVLSGNPCCKDAVKELCTYRSHKNIIKGPPACVPFAPWKL